ncbi:hypothetical protein [Streptomyces sp. cg40]|uniref:hypothetical protein n=1 Tax=Streptomyces sp. cg40 TaxID=3419764 RepID=UPI003D047471
MQAPSARTTAGSPLVAWDPEAGTGIGAMRREAPADTTRRFTGGPCHSFDHVNACTVHENSHAFHAAHHGIITARDLSGFVVLDTDDISAGPIVRIELPTRAP